MKPDASNHCTSPEFQKSLIMQAVGHSGMSRVDLAWQVGISRRALGNYESGERAMPYPVQFCLEALCEEAL